MPDERTLRRWRTLPWLVAGALVLLVSVWLVRTRPESAARAAQAPAYAGGLGVRELVPVLPESRLARPVSLTLLREPASAQWYGGVAALDSVLALWKARLEATGATVRLRQPDELVPDEPLVVGPAPCLSAGARRALLDAAQRGSGLVLVGRAGTRDGSCRPVGWGLVARLTAAGLADSTPSDTDTFIVVPADAALSTGIPPGSRLELRRAHHIALRSPGRDTYYGDWSLNPAPAQSAPLVDGAVVRGSDPRVIYLGFDPTMVADRPWDHAIASLLLRNIVAYAAGIALAAPEAWPHGKRAAAVIAQDVEDEFANARHALDTLRAAGVPATYFVVSRIAREHAALLRDLDAHGEIGSHSEDHRLLGGAPAAEQRERLADNQKELRELTGKPAGGLRPPEERFDLATLHAWRAAGGRYVVASNDFRTPSPELVLVDGRPMVLLGRAADDDFVLVRSAGVTDPRRLATAQLDAWAKLRALGGLYVMSYHSNMLARRVSVPALGRVARALRADSLAWLTTTGEVADWWLARRSLVTEVLSVTDDSVAVRVRNEGETDVPAFIVRVTAPGEPALVRLPVPALAKGEERTIATARRGGGS